MITSSILNSVTFKDLSNAIYPTDENTLHADRKQGAFTAKAYWQKYNLNDVIYLQFTSDSATIPELKSYIPVLNETTDGTLVSSYSGLDDRYFYNFEITLGASYHEKCISFTVTQDSDTLTSEPILCTDISEDIQRGLLVHVKYYNLDRNNSDLSDRWVDWSAIDFMYFYIEAVNYKPNDSDEVEVLTGSQGKTNISSNYFIGNILETAGIPSYMATKLGNVTGLDVFEINGIQYIKPDGIEQDQLGQSTSVQVSINLTKKYVTGLNVDDLGLVNTNIPVMSIKPQRNTGVTTGGWEVDTPEGYMLHSIFATHANTSASSVATMKVGTTISGSELIDAVQGEIPKATYTVALKKWKSYPRHYLKDPSATSKVYVSISGAGSVLDIIINFETVTPES